MEFYAHKREMPDGAIVTQTVREHLVGTAQRAAQCLRQVGLEHAGYLAGLLHDLGKYTEAFQQYLDEGDSTKRGSVIHTFQGCRYLMEQYHRGDIQTISCAELLAFAVGAHHGLFDCVDQSDASACNIAPKSRTSPMRKRSLPSGRKYRLRRSRHFLQRLRRRSTKSLVAWTGPMITIASTLLKQACSQGCSCPQ